jgi:G3E family GTPase
MQVVPITLITGFLGSGKSTLINRILSENKHLKIGLIVNEFGDVNLESQMIETTDEEIVELNNGCMCCVVRKDITGAVQKLLDTKKVNYILVEASGLSDPIPIAQTFLMNNMENQIRLDSILCVVDVENFTANAKNFEITMKQLSSADILLLSKVDLIPKEQLDGVTKVITEYIQNAVVLPIDSKLSLSQIIDTSQFDHTDISELSEIDADEGDEHEGKHEDAHHHHEEKHSHDEHDHCEHGEDEHCDHCNHDHSSQDEHHEESEHEHDAHHHGHTHDHHHEDVETLFFKSEKPFDFQRLSELLVKLPKTIVRAKGFFYLTNVEHDMKYLLQFVGARKQMLMRQWKDGEKRQSAVVFIGKEFDKKSLQEQLTNCLA